LRINLKPGPFASAPSSLILFAFMNPIRWLSYEIKV
jgi:hypothetical protein